MNRLLQSFPSCKTRMSVIGMIHVKSLPSAPKGQMSVNQLIESALIDTHLYLKHKIDGICIENMHDIPYVTRADSGPEVISIMTRICTEVKRIAQSIPCGVQVLAALNNEALAIALASDFQFIRAEAYVYGHIADEGYINACAGPLLRYRRSINADHILVLTDIKKKHSSHAITNDINIVQTAQTAKFFLSDGVIITGESTGDAPNIDDVRSVRTALSEFPVIIGSGVNDANFSEFSKLNVNAAIIGSHFKINGKWENEIDERRLEMFMNNIN